jgi:hypothetical protein
MGSRLGHDFSRVRVHTDAKAFESAEAVNARAFTIGQHVVFGRGQYAPQTTQGHQMLAHELVHTIQQAGSPSAGGELRRIPMSPEGTPFEGEIIPWSAALHAEESRRSRVLADLPRNQRVTVKGGRAWIQVEVTIGGNALTGFVSHELIRQVAPKTASEHTDENEAEHASKQVADAGTAAAPPKKEEQKEPPDQFKYDAGLDPELKKRFNRMVVELDKRGIKRGTSYGDTGQVRLRRTAHIVSTAHHIRERKEIHVADLKALPGGADKDGNVWYRTDWEQTSHFFGTDTPTPPAEIKTKADKNAFDLATGEGADYTSGGHVHCAYEGYEPSDEHRKPNVLAVPMTNHVTGNAIDLKGINWDAFGGPWSQAANDFVATFGLTRPLVPGGTTYCIEEKWHFELGPEPKPDAGPGARSREVPG